MANSLWIIAAKLSAISYQLFMRYFRTFFLQFQDILTDRSKAFVWFLLAFINPLIMLLFWKGATQGGPINGWTFQELSTYYFLLIVAGSMLMAHIEMDISYLDVQKGRLSMYMVKPFSYILFKFFVETAYRIFMGIFAIISLVFFLIFFRDLFTFSLHAGILFLAIVISILGYLISFLFKMILGILSLWFVDNYSLYEVVEIFVIVFAGFLMPIALLPDVIQTIAKFLPLPYMIYYPVAAFTGKLSLSEIVSVLFIQLLWIGVLFLLYKFIWSIGIKRFTGVGL